MSKIEAKRRSVAAFLLGVVSMLLVALPLMLSVSCESLPFPIEACYTHPVYGEVCIKMGGRRYYDPKLTPEQRAEVDKWIDQKEGKAP